MSTSDLAHRIEKAIRGQRRGPRDTARIRREQLQNFADSMQLMHEQAQAALVLDQIPDCIREARQAGHDLIHLYNIGPCGDLSKLTGVALQVYVAMRNEGLWDQCFIQFDQSGFPESNNRLCLRFKQAD